MPKRAGTELESLEKSIRAMEECVKKQDGLIEQKKAADAAAAEAKKAAAKAKAGKYHELQRVTTSYSFEILVLVRSRSLTRCYSFVNSLYLVGSREEESPRSQA